MIQENVTVYCVGGFMVTGTLIDFKTNLFSNLLWLKISTRSSLHLINREHIIAIKYGNHSPKREQSSRD